MLKVMVKCKDVSAEKLAECLAQTAVPFFRVWFFNKRVYVIFKVAQFLYSNTLLKTSRNQKCEVQDSPNKGSLA